MDNVIGLIGDPSKIETPRSLYWLQRSKSAALIWNAMRIWLGVMWLQAGIAKVWGAENPAFLHNNGAGVAGFAAHGVPAYSWWGSFLHSFVPPTRDGSPSSLPSPNWRSARRSPWDFSRRSLAWEAFSCSSPT